MTYDSDYEVRLATLEAMGGDVTKKYDSVYEIDLEILNIIQHGGGGAVIDDDHVSTETTWSSSKIVSELANAGFDIEIVTELPTTGDPHTIYFIASSSSQTGNVYDEYMYINSNWEQVGSTAVDLSNYYTKSEIDTSVGNALASKQDTLTAGTNITITNNVISATGDGSIDDNNVSTGTTFSSAKIVGEIQYDITTNGYYNQFDLYKLHQYAHTLTNNTSVRLDLRSDVYFIIDFYKRDAHQQFTLESTQTGDIAFVITMYNPHCGYNVDITLDGIYNEIYVSYSDTTSSSDIYLYNRARQMLNVCGGGTNYRSLGLNAFGIAVYGWDSLNNSDDSTDWGWLKYDSGKAFAPGAFNTGSYGNIFTPVLSNNSLKPYVKYNGMNGIHYGGFVGYDDNNAIAHTSSDNYLLYESFFGYNGLATGAKEKGKSFRENINGNYVYIWHNTDNDYYQDGGTYYAPTTAGTAGQYLVSSGSGAPVWQALEVASDYVISDADASAGIYSADVSAFYAKSIEANAIQGVQIKMVESQNVSAYSVDDTNPIGTLSDGDLFVVANGETATIVVNDGNDHTISIAADGTITDADSTGAVASSNAVEVEGGHLYEFDGNSTYNWVSITSNGAYAVIIGTDTVTSDAYYLPSSSRIYNGNVELWLMYTEEGQTWQNNHYLITSNSISKDVSTGYFGVNPSVLNDISTALNTILNGNQNS